MTSENESKIEAPRASEMRPYVSDPPARLRAERNPAPKTAVPPVVNLRSSGAVIKKIPFIGYFWEKSFFHYAWVSALYSILNIFLLWLFIDIFKIHTVISSVIVIGGTFVLRYVLFRLLKIMG